MNHRHRLLELLVERSLRLGDFTLASGARSSYYIDARRTTMCAEGQALVGRLGLHALRQSGLEPDWVGGLTMGADPVAYAMAHRSWTDRPVINAFSVRKQAKGHGTGNRIEGGLPTGARVMVVEDSLTSGSSSLRAVDALRDHGAEILGVFTLVDREGGGESLLRETAGLRLIRLFTARELLGFAGHEMADPVNPEA
ncbi:MAG: orotate phosphoribosyltransferase [Gemmatimonadales bacterium]|nr:MAG: orotate phosphoribosyltransferase [Gemmatimonadales bacterium]